MSSSRWWRSRRPRRGRRLRRGCGHASATRSRSGLRPLPRARSGSQRRRFCGGGARRLKRDGASTCGTRASRARGGSGRRAMAERRKFGAHSAMGFALIMPRCWRSRRQWEWRHARWRRSRRIRCCHRAECRRRTKSASGRRSSGHRLLCWRCRPLAARSTEAGAGLQPSRGRDPLGRRRRAQEWLWIPARRAARGGDGDGPYAQCVRRRSTQAWRCAARMASRLAMGSSPSVRPAMCRSRVRSARCAVTVLHARRVFAARDARRAAGGTRVARRYGGWNVDVLAGGCTRAGGGSWP